MNGLIADTSLRPDFGAGKKKGLMVTLTLIGGSQTVPLNASFETVPVPSTLYDVDDRIGYSRYSGWCCLYAWTIDVANYDDVLELVTQGVKVTR